MRTIILFAITLIISSFSIKNEHLKLPALFSRNVWSEISATDDPTLFKPFSEAFKESGLDNPVALSTINNQNLKKDFDKAPQNLWNAIFKEIMFDRINVYYPYNPEIFMMKDNGFFIYPLNLDNICSPKNYWVDEDEYQNQFTVNELYIFGQFEIDSDSPLVNQFGEDSINSSGYFVYPKSLWNFITDRDVIKYKIREEVFYDKKGIEKKREIKAIGPIKWKIDHFDESFSKEQIICWFNYEDLKPILEKMTYKDESGKVLTYLNYFEKRKFKSIEVDRDKKNK